MRARAAGAARLYEHAPAKVNLTLKVLGRRPDGYHALRSLVAFPVVGDWLELTPGPGASLQIFGAFAHGLESGSVNLVIRAAEAFRERFPDATLGQFQLQKNLPVASGIGGGSADAAAALRLLERANPGLADPESIADIALRLGSDVPVCLASRASVISGRGEHVLPAGPLPLVYILLVNPGVPLSSGDVFSRLNAPSLAEAHAIRTGAPAFPDLERLAAYMRSEGNDLLEAASELAPALPAVIAEISAQDGCTVASMSGSGATCFGLFADAAAVDAATSRIADAHPGWWVKAAELG